MNRRITAALCAATLTLLAACSGSGGSGAAKAHDAADVTFATDMIPHHSQAVQMADLAATRASDPAVTTLAATIKDEQAPEITTMSGWLRSWGESVPAGSTAHMSHGGDAMPGMMSEGSMTALAATTGASFDRSWVTMMTAHHEGALTMARTELAQGRYPAAVALARSIVTTQTKEIATLQQLQRTLR